MASMMCHVPNLTAAIVSRASICRLNWVCFWGPSVLVRRFNAGNLALFWIGTHIDIKKIISDIAGQDIKSHRRKERHAIGMTRDWLSTSSGRTIPGGDYVYRRYAKFNSELPALCRSLKLRKSELTFNDYANIVTKWVEV